MIPKKLRVKKKKDFQTLFKQGKSLANRYMAIYFMPRKENQHIRIGFAVSKKLGTAVQRNKIKRRMRAGIYPLLPQLDKQYDIIIIAREKIKGISFFDVEKNILALLLKAGLIKDD